MDRNLFLAFGLSFAVLLLWTMVFEPPKPPPAKEETAVTSEAPAESTAPPATGEPESAESGLPALEPGEAAPTEPAAPAPAPATLVESRQIPVESSLFRAELDTRGASLAHWELTQYRVSEREGGEPIVLTTGEKPFALGMVTPFEELGIGDLGQAVFDLESQQGNTYTFRYAADGITVRKTYQFKEDTYEFELRVSVENGSDHPVGPRFAINWPAAQRAGNDFREFTLEALHDGDIEKQPLKGFGKPGFFSREPKRVVSFEREIDWAGSASPYFVAALLPDAPSQASARFVATPEGVAVVQLYYDPVSLPPGQPAEHVFRAYLGPKEPKRLEAAGAGLIHSINLGWSWVEPLTRFFGWLLTALYTFIPNYGVAIIVLTVMVRMVTAPLTYKQMRSMERMRALQPKLQELKDKHGDDRQKQSEEMMRLYKQEGVNPLGGCLPMVLQLPVFIGLFYALRSSIHLRQAPFFGWIDDLAAPDMLFQIPGLGIPLRVLPLIMGVTMLAQQRITPMQGMDPAQQKMMSTMMPIVMTVVFYQFPSGLVLYWMVSNLLAIGHQLWIGKNLRK